jgi:hypothetical protein
MPHSPSRTQPTANAWPTHGPSHRWLLPQYKSRPPVVNFVNFVNAVNEVKLLSQYESSLPVARTLLAVYHGNSGLHDQICRGLLINVIQFP